MVLMLLYNGQRGGGHKAFSTGSTRPMYICCMVCPALCITLGSKEGGPLCLTFLQWTMIRIFAVWCRQHWRGMAIRWRSGARQRGG